MFEEIDLWAEEELPNEKSNSSVDTLLSKKEDFEKKEDILGEIPSFKKTVLLFIQDSYIFLFSKKDLRSNLIINNDFESIQGLEYSLREKIHCYKINLTAGNAFILRHNLKRISLDISNDDALILKEFADRIWIPKVSLSESGKHIEVNSPGIKTYMNLLKKVNAYPANRAWRVNLTRALDLQAINSNLETNLPPMEFGDDVLSLNKDPIPGFDGTLNSLKFISIGELNVIKANSQTRKQLKSNEKTLEEKIKTLGIETLYDLIFTMPKRFIDKSEPQDLNDLIEGESTTVIGKITAINDLPKSMGVFFLIEDNSQTKLKVNFWRQQWLKTKFKIGDEVLITGKVSKFKGKIELGGSSIEHSEEAAILPIVPIYKQSESKGITTNLIMSAAREMISRIGKIDLPEYLKVENRMDYSEALKELHFPTNVDNFKKACDDLAYYELVYLQIVMISSKVNNEAKKGIDMSSDSSLQNEMFKKLPFTLTKGQINGIKTINSLLSNPTPSQMMITADVGSGKSICAFFASLKAIESGYQVALIAPTEILAQQLYTTFQQSSLMLEKNITVNLLKSGYKAKEKNEIYKALKNNEIDVIVGTTGILSDKLVFNNLGLVIVDEQQKFGAEHRTKLLNSRVDDLTPHLLMMSATPIPRSTAQAFYGDMELIELGEKPPGRLPITTIWLEEDPQEFTKDLINDVWSDIVLESRKGNQAFIITPMVRDSEKIDAASVESSFENLKNGALNGLRMGFVHGQMKKEQQEEVMTAFRDKELDVLVASTVVEVGVDIPNATRMVILSADRLGAASCHQIRGRIGRNSLPSTCYLVSLGKTDNSRLRLQALVDSENGFEIAMTDLEIRGEGTIFGSDQSGGSEMIFASIARHHNWIEPARNQALSILESNFKEVAIKEANESFNKIERLF